MKWLTALLLAACSCATHVLALDGYSVPPSSPGYQRGNSTQAIQFDSHSLFINGKRTFIMSGEFHPWRLPVPELWSDILQKMKAAGFNTVSIYVHWGLTEGKAGSTNWDNFRSIELFYQIAQRVGLYVIARPGPYINAETTGGGFPGWLTNSAAQGRSGDEEYVESFQQYIAEFARTTSKYQFPDGPVIAVQSENEFFVSQGAAPTATQAMVAVQNALRANGIDRVPLTTNDVWPSGNYASGEGRVDVYGFDAYPGGFDCQHPEVMTELPNYFVSALDAVAPWAFMYLGEFQGGAFDPWQGPGYDACAKMIGPEFANVFYKANVGFGTTAMSLYMLYGGTNWGNIAYPGVYTSYDYGAAIREPRTLSPKYSELKTQGLFYQASPSLLSSSIVGSGAGSPYASNSGVFVTNLAGGENSTTTSYYVLRQTSNNFTTPISTRLTVNTTAGKITIPQFGGQITLAGRESKIFVADYPFGSSTLRYSTAEVMTHATINNTDFILLYVPKGQSVEAVLPSSSRAAPTVTGSSGIRARASNNTIIITGNPSGVSLVRAGSTAVLVADKATAQTFWNPRVSSSSNSSFDLTPDTPSVLVSGPYLVRNATIDSSTLHLVGDTNGTTAITVFAPATVTSVTWNGATVRLSRSQLGVGLSGTLSTRVPSINLPDLRRATWKSADALPEVATNFDDADWVVANKSETNRPHKPFEGDTVLYTDEYGFHAGAFIFRGYFNGTATGVDLSVQGGNAFGFSAFLNGRHIGSGNGANGVDLVNATFSFPQGVVTNGRNVLTIVHDSTGLNGDWNADDEFKIPRGIRKAVLQGGSQFDTWKLMGNVGGEDFPDKVRGPLNEGGLWLERIGAHLPGFDDSRWSTSSPFTGITRAGIQAYRTKFSLNIPAGVDAPLAFRFTATPSSNYRSLLFVNGWQFGRFISNIGPQTTFPVPEGILNHHGENELVLTVWSLDAKGAKVANLQLVSLAAFASGKEEVSSGTVLSPSFNDLRTRA